MRAKGDRLRLAHILESALLISRWLEGVEKGRFLEDELLQEAVIRRLEVIGEAAKNVSPELKERHPEVPWREMSGMRDVLVHEYFGVDLEQVWETASQDVPELARQIGAILQAMG
ncbi:MAG: DUF86 domain-containing protein [Clostridia bacterium]|nr:DUF86 domain-containing protein [Clostridia bacterium]